MPDNSRNKSGTNSADSTPALGTFGPYTPPDQHDEFAPPAFDSNASMAMADRLRHIKRLDNCEEFAAIARAAGVQFDGIANPHFSSKQEHRLAESLKIVLRQAVFS